MSAFDVTLTPINVQLAQGSTTGEQVDLLELVVLVGSVVGPGQAFPIGIVRIPFNRQLSINLGSKLVEEGEKLPEESDLVVASSLQGIEKLADVDRRIHGDR